MHQVSCLETRAPPKKKEPPPGRGAAPVFAPGGGIPLERGGKTCVLPGWPPTIGQGASAAVARGEGAPEPGVVPVRTEVRWPRAYARFGSL